MTGIQSKKLHLITLILMTSTQTAWAGDAPANYSRKTITLSALAVIGGISVRAGTVEEFEPGDLFAHGVLSQGTSIQQLALPAGTDVNMDIRDPESE
jgi:hypothetical protein